MKKLIITVFGLLLTAGCATQGMNVEYMASTDAKLTAQPVYLEVIDKRSKTGLISGSVKEKEIFENLGDAVNLDAKGPDGAVLQLRDASLEKAFYEAFRMRLEAAGLGVLPARNPDAQSLTIILQTVWLDLEGRDFKSEVTYEARFARQGRVYYKETISGRAQRMRLMGKTQGEEAMSEAVTMAVNRLELDPLTK
jgi:hypothetical protein